MERQDRPMQSQIAFSMNTHEERVPDEQEQERNEQETGQDRSIESQIISSMNTYEERVPDEQGQEKNEQENEEDVIQNCLRRIEEISNRPLVEFVHGGWLIDNVEFEFQTTSMNLVDEEQERSEDVIQGRLRGIEEISKRPLVEFVHGGWLIDNVEFQKSPAMTIDKERVPDEQEQQEINEEETRQDRQEFQELSTFQGNISNTEIIIASNNVAARVETGRVVILVHQSALQDLIVCYSIDDEEFSPKSA